jgi:hypothetical protein
MASQYLVGVSVPRSGHHFLARLLQAACGERLRYCDFYETPGCCRQVPCARASTPLHFQKNHDLQLRLPTDLPGVRYVVQLRDPVAAALSDRELFAARHGEALAADRPALLLWLATQALWLEDFWAKWVDPAPAAAVLLTYERLTAEPAAALHGLLAALGIAATQGDCAAAVAVVAPRGGFHGEIAYRRRRLTESRFFDGELFALYETLLFGRLPLAGAQRLLPAHRDPAHPLTRCWQALRAARRGDLQTALEGLEALSASLGHPAALEAEAARLLQAAGQPGPARQRLAGALRDRPDDPALLLRWVELCRALAEPRAAVEQARRLVALMPDEVGHRVLLALLLGEAGARTEVAAAVAAARALDPLAPLDWCSLGLALLHGGEPAAALELLDQALARWPGHAGLATVRARALAEAPAPGGAPSAQLP